MSPSMGDAVDHRMSPVAQSSAVQKPCVVEAGLPGLGLVSVVVLLLVATGPEPRDADSCAGPPRPPL